MNVAIEQIELPRTRMIVKRDALEETFTKTGLTLGQLDSTPETGVILVTGPECVLWKVGDRVYFADGSGRPVKFYGDEYLLMDEHQALFKINKKVQETV